MAKPVAEWADIPPDVRKQLGLKRPRAAKSMNMHTVRTYSIRVLHVVADMTQKDRARVLRHALKVNEV